MNLITKLFHSSLGKKYVMALTGLALFGFVIGHLIGNLQVFGPPELINGYAHFLKSKPLLLWGARLGLLVMVGLHIFTAFRITAENRAARPVGYAVQKDHGATLAARTMIYSGLVILAFIIYHLAHFTVLISGVNGVGDFSKLHTVLNGETVPDVYGMMILGFQVGWVALFYLVAQALLFMHLSHGLASMFQSLGFRNHVWWPRIGIAVKAISVAVFIGYAAIPAAIYMRVIGADYADKVKFEIQQPQVAAPLTAAAVTEKEGVK